MYFRSFERLAWGQVVGPEQVRPALTLLGQLLRPGEVVELRVFSPGSTLLTNGYFNDPGKLVQAVMEWEGRAEVVVSVNPVRRDLLAAAPNKLRSSAGWLSTTRDIARYAALVVPFPCREYLRGQGWSEPVVLVDSLLYAVNLPATQESTELIWEVKIHLARHCGGTVNSTPSMLRLSDVVQEPSVLYQVDVELLRQVVANTAPEQTTVVVEEPVADDALTRFVREECVLEPGVWTPTGKLYGEYDAFCYMNEVEPLGAPRFSRDLTARYSLTLERRKVQGVVTRGIRGIRLRQMTIER